MCRRATIRFSVVFGLWVVSGWYSWAQTPSLDWRHIGNAAIELALPSVATGPVDRVWYSNDGATLYLRTVSGRTFETSTFEKWTRVTDSRIVPPSRQNPPSTSVPEVKPQAMVQAAGSNRLYSVGRNVYRSDDGGLNWSNLTAYRGVSILGGEL